MIHIFSSEIKLKQVNEIEIDVRILKISDRFSIHQDSDNINWNLTLLMRQN